MSLIITQVIFGGGAVVGKFGVSNFNPILFALIRECIAGPLLLLIAYKSSPEKKMFWVSRSDWVWFAAAGFCMFSNQLCFIVGEKLSSAVVGSAWQPSQPLFLSAISIMLGWERASSLRIAGILVAFLGAAFMVTTSSTDFGAVIILSAGGSAFAGNCLFFLNCLGTAGFVLFGRKLLAKYNSPVVTGWSYCAASLQMAVASVVINTNQGE